MRVVISLHSSLRIRLVPSVGRVFGLLLEATVVFNRFAYR